MKVKTVIEMDYGELETLVNNHYGLPHNGDGYEFVAVQECGNDSAHTFYIPKAEPLNKYNQYVIDKLRSGKAPIYHNHTILQDLVNNGVLAPGEYLIKVSW
jgi:hypothetical protein